jgi:phosphoribosylformylglycinamidine cyclo-ligase
MYRTFNMGHRLELYIDPHKAEKLIAISESFGVKAQVIGRVEKYSGKKLTISSDETGTFEYS